MYTENIIVGIYTTYIVSISLATYTYTTNICILVGDDDMSWAVLES